MKLYNETFCYSGLAYVSHFVLNLFSVILVLSSLPVSPMYFLAHSHGMLYIQFFFFSGFHFWVWSL
jgi:hypothetical protein